MNEEKARSLRAANKAAFLKLLGHLGRKEFDEFEAYLAEDFVQEWPYLPLASMEGTLRGAHEMRLIVERGMADFDPYEYTIEQIHEQLDPEMLIAEYSSHSHYHPRQVPYSNRYISVMRFRGGKIAHWIEYVNPLIVKEVMGLDADMSIEERFESNRSFQQKSS